jgi:hypothetical protein
MHHRGLLTKAGQYSGALQQRIVKDKCRPHMYEYVLFMHMGSISRFDQKRKGTGPKTDP